MAREVFKYFRADHVPRGLNNDFERARKLLNARGAREGRRVISAALAFRALLRASGNGVGGLAGAVRRGQAAAAADRSSKAVTRGFQVTPEQQRALQETADHLEIKRGAVGRFLLAAHAGRFEASIEAGLTEDDRRVTRRRRPADRRRAA